MKEHPIIFSTDMVKAILDGRKTQTRRVIKTQPSPNAKIFSRGLTLSKTWQEYDGYYEDAPPRLFDCPYGQVGDRLWVREKYAFCAVDDRTSRALYFDCNYTDIIADKYDKTKLGWHPSIHMPRWASRITLEITGIRVERLQEITPDDIKAEGIDVTYTGTKQWSVGMPYSDMAKLWDSLNAKRGYGWEVNPWVWVIEFKKC